MTNLVTRYDEIVNVANIGKMAPQDFAHIAELAARESGVGTRDPYGCLLLCIDEQNDFMDNGKLGVPGACKDIERLTHFIYNNIDKISRIFTSIDFHSMQQIFHPCWWIDKNGNHPAPYTVITTQDVRDGKWMPIIGRPAKSLAYLEGLEASAGKKQLCIWPYHCIGDTPGATLENEFANMLHFHSLVAHSRPHSIRKGTNPMSEMYGIIKPEYSERNEINKDALDQFEKFGEIYIAGEAKSHCVLESIRQILEYFENRPDITQKITILVDCMSSIPGYEDATEVTFKEFQKKYGVKFADSTLVIG